MAALLGAPLVAQGQIQLGANIGYRIRPEGGTRVRGAQIEGMLIVPRGQWEYQGLLTIAQMSNHYVTGEPTRENSVEGTLLFRRALAYGLGAGIGPTLSVATGCASGGSGDGGGLAYGTVPCLVPYANKGTFRPGYTLQLDYVRTNARGISLRAGLRAMGHTVASGSKTPKPGAWLGFSAPFAAR